MKEFLNHRPKDSKSDTGTIILKGKTFVAIYKKIFAPVSWFLSTWIRDSSFFIPGGEGVLLHYHGGVMFLSPYIFNPSYFFLGGGGGGHSFSSPGKGGYI